MKLSIEDRLQCGASLAARTDRRVRGFALVVSLSLMVLLTVIAVGLLSLSAISLRAGSHGEAMAVARANARMALSMAIGEVQKFSGPDQRITMTADQMVAGGGDESAASPEKRHWTGVYRSWPAGAADRPEPEFLSWLVSSPDRDARKVESAKSTASQTEAVRVVGEGTLGPDGPGIVEVPLVPGDKQGGLEGRFAWWVGDQGVKAALAAPVSETSESPAFVRQTLQASPRHAVQLAAAGSGEMPFRDLSVESADVKKITGWRQAEHLAAAPSAPRPLFHDLAPFSTGLLTNVRSGGFRKDLSMHLERDLRRAPKEALYRVSGQDGINMAELWLHYNMWKELKTRGLYAFTTGGSLGSNTRFLQVEGSMSLMTADPEHFYKQPAFVAYHTVVSFNVRSNNRLALVIDPIVTYWNPLDVPVVLTPAYNSIKFWQLPYDLRLEVGGKTISSSMRNILAGGAYQYLTLIAGKSQPIVLRPGEVLTVSQGPNTGIQPYETGTLRYLEGKAGWNFGGGISVDLKDSAGNYVVMNSADSLRYTVTPNGQISDGTRHWSLNHHETYYKEDRTDRGESVGIGGVYIDSIYGLPHNEANPKPAGSRLNAASHPRIFDKVKPEDTRPLSGAQLSGRKEPVMMFSYVVKTENGTERGAGRCLQRFNPKAMNVDFYNLSEAEFDLLPFEVQIQPLNSWKNRNLEVSTNGNGYFGAGMNAEFGTSFITTHSVPREPLYSLGALQHAFANGFSSLNPPTGYAIVNARYPMLPQVSHPIGNSVAPAVIPPNRTQGTLAGGPRVLADHSYLANNALWDDWFFSGIAPQTASTFAKSRSQSVVAKDFFNGVSPLPVTRYLPDTRGKKIDDVVSLFSSAVPSTEATALVASLLRVDGMFNVNSTSVEAWKAVLGGLKNRPVTIRNRDGGEAVAAGEDSTPVAGLFTPQDQIADGEGLADVKDAAQWVGRRVLSDGEIDALARAIVRQVRKRGPFLSLADFVNRRVGNDKELARAGTVQSALDDRNVPVNRAWSEGGRAVSATASGRMTFPEAEQGPASTGIPGIVKQADILTPIAPLLSARSDSFVIRAYGDAVDAGGKVLARAWCEAVVERDKEFIDPADKPETPAASLRKLNLGFGRRYKVQSFRWLNPREV